MPAFAGAKSGNSHICDLVKAADHAGFSLSEFFPRQVSLMLEEKCGDVIKKATYCGHCIREGCRPLYSDEAGCEKKKKRALLRKRLRYMRLRACRKNSKFAACWRNRENPDNLSFRLLRLQHLLFRLYPERQANSAIPILGHKLGCITRRV